MPNAEADKEMFARMDREAMILAKPAVMHIPGGPYYPEVMCGGQWSAGDPVGSHSEAKKIAQKACDEINLYMQDQGITRCKALFKPAKP